MRIHLYLLLLIGFFLSSCNSGFHIEKRKYNKGFYVTKTKGISKSNEIQSSPEEKNIDIEQSSPHLIISAVPLKTEINTRPEIDVNKTQTHSKPPGQILLTDTIKRPEISELSDQDILRKRKKHLSGAIAFTGLTVLSLALSNAIIILASMLAGVFLMLTIIFFQKFSDYNKVAKERDILNSEKEKNKPMSQIIGALVSGFFATALFILMIALAWEYGGIVILMLIPIIILLVLSFSLIKKAQDDQSYKVSVGYNIAKFFTVLFNLFAIIGSFVSIILLISA